MQLTLFNASPRGKKGNSRFILDAFAEGFNEIHDGHDTVRIIDLPNSKNYVNERRIFAESDHVIIAFPLYIDSIPSGLKYFFETFGNYRKQKKVQSLGFIVQSGFPGAVHSRSIETYLKNFTKRIGCRYKGTLIKGGGEAIKIASLQNNFFSKMLFKAATLTDLGGMGHLLDKKRHFKLLNNLGKQYKRKFCFDTNLVKKLDHPKHINQFNFLLFKLIAELFYWKPLLAKHKASHLRDRTPYVREMK